MEDTLKWVSHGITDVGNIRKLNEDSLLERKDIGMWVIADGMGGHSAGEVASKMLVSALKGLQKDQTLSEYAEKIENCIIQVNGRLRDRAAKTSKKIIGTTVVLLTVYEDYGLFFWAGDSRLYRLREGNLYQLTLDHSQVAEELNAGMISVDQALTHPFRNRITRAVGGSDQLYLDLDLTRIEPGDRYLLCSDGLNGYASDTEILEIIKAEAEHTPLTACDQLLELVHSHGAGDNVTMIVVDIERSK